MIGVQKALAQPKKLREDGVAQAEVHCTEYDAEPDKYQSGKKKFVIKRAIYAHPSVKKALTKCQYNKCCYCESKFTANYAGDVEHFRPKQGVQQDVGVAIEYPGYYWLSYDWTNLFFSCAICNSTYKKNLFPLVKTSDRAHDHHGNLGQEQPLFVGPGGPEDPRDHIRFHQEIPVARTRRGEVTIRNLGLDRRNLNEERRLLLDELKRAREVIKLLSEDQRPEIQQLVCESRDLLYAAVKPHARFSSMAQDLLRE